MTKLSGWVSLLCLGLAFSRSACAGLEELQYLTEEYKPFNYTLPSGQAGGIAVELLQRIWLRTGTPAQTIRFLPWARGYLRLQQQPNTVLFSTARTRNREPQFRWACPIAKTPIVLLGLRSRHLYLENLQQLRAYHVMAVRSDVGEQVLRSQINAEVRLDTTHAINLALQQLKAGRIDLISFNERVARQTWQEMGEQESDLQTVWDLGAQEFCYAFNPQTTPELIATFQHALQQEIASPHYPALLQRYQLAP